MIFAGGVSPGDNETALGSDGEAAFDDDGDAAFDDDGDAAFDDDGDAAFDDDGGDLASMRLVDLMMSRLASTVACLASGQLEAVIGDVVTATSSGKSDEDGGDLASNSSPSSS